MSAELRFADDELLLRADLEFTLGARLEEAVSRGVPLHFIAEFELERQRRFWFNQTIASRTLSYRLSYHPLTDQYRLSLGTLHQSFDTLSAAILTMQRIRNWAVAAADAVAQEEQHQAALRFRLDGSKLPKPFQVGALGSSDWSLSTDWFRWTPKLSAEDKAESAPTPASEPVTAAEADSALKPEPDPGELPAKPSGEAGQ